MTVHEDELAITDDTVRALLGQKVGYADLPLHELGSPGSSNRLVRLGADRLVRLPRQPGGTATILKEARWSPHLAAGLSVRIPTVEYVGRPDEHYPEGWSVTDWIEGRTPTTLDPLDLAELLRELRALPVPDQTAQDPELRWYRAEPPAAIDDDIRDCLHRCRQLPGLDVDIGQLTSIWERAVSLPTREARSWVHADLLAENLLVDADGRLVAVLDFGGACIGDPTVDLIAAWELLDPLGRNRLRGELEIDDDEWDRARGWVVAIAALTFSYYWTSMPARRTSRLTMVRALLADQRTHV